LKKPASNSSASIDIIEKVKNGEKKDNDNDNEDNADKIVNIIDLNESLDLKSDKSVSETGSEGTPSEKENISCEMFGKMSKSKSKESAADKNGLEVKAKRERKRKRFADEEPELPAMKKSAKKVTNAVTVSPTPAVKNGKKCPATATQVLTQAKSNKNSPESVKKKSLKSKSLDNSLDSKPSSKGTVTNSRAVKTSSPNGPSSSSLVRSSDKQYGYLSFDFSLPSEQQIENLIDGVTVPSHSKPVLIKSPKLPNGWVKKVVLRGVNHFKWEVLIENTSLDGNGRSFRSKADLQRFFDEQKLTHNMDNFDFSLDTPLKKIRQIWRSTLHQPDPVKPTSNGVKEVKEPDSSLDSRLQSDGLLKKSVKSPNSLKGQLKIDIPVASPTSHALSPTPAPVSVSSSSKINSVNSPCILKGNASETGQGVRCPIKTCNKLFRNDKLLLMHVKHYHPEHAHVHSPTVTDLAFNRTVKEEVPGSVNEAVKPELSSVKSSDQEDNFKVPDGKPVIKSEPSEPEKSKAVPEDKIETDGVATETSTKSETENIQVEGADSSVKESVSLPETPKLPASSRSRPKRLRSEAESPPASPSAGQTLSSLHTVKMSKKRARSAPSTPPGEMKDGTETMSEGEVVHCICSHTEGDGMMVQCDSCLTWQHGQCLGIDSPNQVPEKYVCSICLSPPLGRKSSLYNIDMDWIREGKLSRLAPGYSQVETDLKTLSDLMLDLVNLSNVLQSLQVKLSVARQKNNPKVFMWSSVWEDGDVTTEDEEMQEEQEDNKEEKKEEIFNNITSSLEAVEEMEIAKEDVKEEEEEKKEEEEMVTENGENDSKPSDLNNSGTEIPVEAEKNKETPVISSQNENNETEQKTEMTEETKNSSIPSVPQENPSNFGSELAEYFSTEGFDISNFIPSVSEMQRLLPDVIKDISGSLSANQSFTPNILPPPTIIPEPKRLDRDECRLNLILHIENLQKHIQNRLEKIDTELEVLEKKKEREVSPVLLASTMQDLRSAKIVNNSLPDRM